MSESGKNRREKAAAARDAANASEKKRERTVRIVGAITVVVVVIAIIGVAVIAKKSSSSTSAADNSSITAAADPGAPTPKGVYSGTDPNPYGVPYLPAKDGLPTLAIWEDFQCPACEAVEKANGAGIESLADQGKINLVYRPTTFLDRNLGNDSSRRALAAWGCAIDQGATKEFHNTVYANPPAKEGDGFTDEQIIGFAKTAGVKDIAAFTTCYNDKTYLPWAANTTQAFLDSNIQGTPFATLNGVEVPTATLVDQAALEKLVADTAAGKAPSAAASPAAS